MFVGSVGINYAGSEPFFCAAAASTTPDELEESIDYAVDSDLEVNLTFDSRITDCIKGYRIVDIGGALDYNPLMGEFCLVTSINENGQIAGYYLKSGKKVDFVFDLGKGIISSNSYAWNGGARGPGIPPFIDSNGRISNVPVNSYGDSAQVNHLNQLVVYSGGECKIEQTKKWVQHNGWRNLRINDNGHVVGVIDEGQHPPKDTIAIFNIITNELTTVPLKSSAFLTGINDKNQVIGWTNAGGRVKGFIWHKEYGFQIIPNFIPSAINNNGVVVGRMAEGSRAAIYESGILRPMNDVLGIEYEFNSYCSNLSEIADINDKGWMIGWGQRPNGFHNEQHPFLIIPS